MVALRTFIGYIYFPFPARKKLSKTESHTEPGILDFPQGRRELGLSMSFLDTQHVWSLRFKAKWDVRYFLRSC